MNRPVLNDRQTSSVKAKSKHPIINKHTLQNLLILFYLIVMVSLDKSMSENGQLVVLLLRNT